MPRRLISPSRSAATSWQAIIPLLLHDVVDETRDQPPAEKVLLHQIVRVVGSDAAVPDAVGIDDQRRTFAAAPHAAGARDAKLLLLAGVLDLPAQRFDERVRSA